MNRGPSQNGARRFKSSRGVRKKLPTPNRSDAEAWMPSEGIKGIVFIFESEMEAFLLLLSKFLRGYRASHQGLEFSVSKQINKTATCSPAFGRRDHRVTLNIPVS